MHIHEFLDPVYYAFSGYKITSLREGLRELLTAIAQLLANRSSRRRLVL